MGFEVIYHYFSRNEDGKYNTEEKSTLSKKIGQPYEETSYDQLASAIISQLARRDIWIQDVEVFEYTKKQVKFKESGSGIILKNKKYSLDSGLALVAEAIEETPVPAPSTALAPTSANLAQPNVNLAQSNRVMFHVHFEPEAWTNEAKQKGLKFTVGKKYPVHKAVDNNVGGQYIGQKYTLTDDLNRQVTVDEKYFVVAGRGLVADAELGFSNPASAKSDIRLSHSDAYIEDVPDVRRGVRQKPAQYAHIPIDGEGIDHLLGDEMPDIRRKK